MLDVDTLIFMGSAVSAMPINSSGQLKQKGKALIWLADQIDAAHKEQGHDVRTAVDSDS